MPRLYTYTVLVSLWEKQTNTHKKRFQASFLMDANMGENSTHLSPSPVFNTNIIHCLWLFRVFCLEGICLNIKLGLPLWKRLLWIVLSQKYSCRFILLWGSLGPIRINKQTLNCRNKIAKFSTFWFYLLSLHVIIHHFYYFEKYSNRSKINFPWKYQK